MVKDYEYHRSKFITHVMDHLYKTISSIEKLDSPIERIAVMQVLKFRDAYGSRVYHVYSQMPVGNYIADIVINTDLQKVAIECDGHDFHEKTKSQASKDKKRDREFQKEGYIILRYTGSEIVNEPQIISDDLKKIFNVDPVTVKEG